MGDAASGDQLLCRRPSRPCPPPGVCDVPPQDGTCQGPMDSCFNITNCCFASPALYCEKDAPATQLGMCTSVSGCASLHPCSPRACVVAGRPSLPAAVHRAWAHSTVALRLRPPAVRWVRPVRLRSGQRMLRAQREVPAERPSRHQRLLPQREWAVCAAAVERTAACCSGADAQQWSMLAGGRIDATVPLPRDVCDHGSAFWPPAVHRAGQVWLRQRHRLLRRQRLPAQRGRRPRRRLRERAWGAKRRAALPCMPAQQQDAP